MKKILIVLTCFLVSFSVFSQSRKHKNKEKTVNVSTTFNYYPELPAYSFFDEFESDQDQLLLLFINRNSGTFILTENDPLTIAREDRYHIPTHSFGVGASVQVINSNRWFHELSLTKLAVSKSSQTIHYSWKDTLDRTVGFVSGYDLKSSAFGFRYELGKYFGKRKKAKVRFGLSASVEPSFYFFKRIPYAISEFPLKANVFTIEMAVIPSLSVKVAKKVTVEFKVVPNVLMAEAAKIDKTDPTVPLGSVPGRRELENPEINVGFGLMVRYAIKEPARVRRRPSG